MQLHLVHSGLDLGGLQQLLEMGLAEVGHANVLEDALLLEFFKSAPGLVARRRLGGSME